MQVYGELVEPVVPPCFIIEINHSMNFFSLFTVLSPYYLSQSAHLAGTKLKRFIKIL